MAGLGELAELLDVPCAAGFRGTATDSARAPASRAAAAARSRPGAGPDGPWSAPGQPPAYRRAAAGSSPSAGAARRSLALLPRAPGPGTGAADWSAHPDTPATAARPLTRPASA